MANKSSVPRSILIALSLFACSGVSSARADATTIDVRSPNGLAGIQFFLRSRGQTESVPHYLVYSQGGAPFLESRLSIAMDEGPPLGGPCTITSVQVHSHHASYTMFPGKRRRVTDHYSEAVIGLREQRQPERLWELILRAYDDGVAFRYRFPAQKGWTDLRIAAEHTDFTLAPAALVYALPLNGFTTSYERLYAKKPVKDIRIR